MSIEGADEPAKAFWSVEFMMKKKTVTTAVRGEKELQGPG
jgi:hypothetical protein